MRTLTATAARVAAPRTASMHGTGPGRKRTHPLRHAQRRCHIQRLQRVAGLYTYTDKFTALPPADRGEEQSQRRGSVLFPGPSWRKSQRWQFARRDMTRRGVLNRFDLSASAAREQAARVACNGTPSITRATQPCCGPTQGNLRFFSRFNVPVSSAKFVLSAAHSSRTRDQDSANACGAHVTALSRFFFLIALLGLFFNYVLNA